MKSNSYTIDHLIKDTIGEIEHLISLLDPYSDYYKSNIPHYEKLIKKAKTSREDGVGKLSTLVDILRCVANEYGFEKGRQEALDLKHRRKKKDEAV